MRALFTVWLLIALVMFPAVEMLGKSAMVTAESSDENDPRERSGERSPEERTAEERATEEAAPPLERGRPVPTRLAAPAPRRPRPAAPACPCPAALPPALAARSLPLLT